jgi:protein tyrosine phosphatase (PTP) superfamily phosphohydrolase (DUF442 family)
MMLFITENEVMEWVIPNRLARSSRPGYPCTDIGPATVDSWMADIRRNGIVAILCLLAEDQLAHYQSIPGGLLSYYRKAGFCVEHIGVQDHQVPPLSKIDLQKIWDAYQSIDKPVLIHCSAGEDRTGCALAYIQEQLLHRHP